MKKGFCDATVRTSHVNNLPKNLNLLDSRLNRSRHPGEKKNTWYSGYSNCDCESSGQTNYVSSDSSALLKPQEVAKLFLPDKKARRNSCANLKKTYCNHCDASENNNMKALKSPSNSNSKHVGDFHNDRFSNNVKSPTSKTQEYSNLDGGDLTDMSSSSKMSNPFFLNQKRCLGRKPSKLSKARKRSTMSVIKEGKFELHCGDYFRGATRDQVDGGRRLNRTSANSKVTFDTKLAHLPLVIPTSHPRSCVEDTKDRSGPSLESLGICKGELDIKCICAPPKKNIHDALYQRVATFINPDISVIIDSYEFLCHKIVLQCYSEYFEELKNHPEVVVEGVTKGAFIAIYNWMLAPGLEGLRYIQKNNILEVLIASKILIIKELENQCLAFIDSKEAFSEDNAYLLFIDASRRQQMEIMELMVPRIQTFFLVLVSTVEFTELEVDDLCTILQSNYIVVHCEVEVFMAAVKWLMAKWENRVKLLGVVMKCIRFGLMTPAQLVDIRKNPMSPEFMEITNDKTVQMLIEDGLAYSVESGLTGKTDHHAQRCELLKLKIPEPRNWAKNSKEYKSYGDFLNYLDEITKDPQSFYADIKKDCANNDLFANEVSSSSSSSDESFDSKIQVHARVPLNSKKPSLSDLLCKEKTKQNAKYSNAKLEHTDQKFYSKSGRIQDEKPSTEDWRIDKTSVRPNKNSKDFIINSHVMDKQRIPHISPKRMSLIECAAIIIQSTFRGYLVRKGLRKVEPPSEWNSEPSKKVALDNMFLRVKSNSDWERAVSDGDFSVGQRSGRRLKTKTTLTRSSSNESNESIISVKEGPAYRRKPLFSTCEKSVLLYGGVNPLGEQPSACQARQVYRYSSESNSWDKVDTMPSPRYYHGSSILRGKVYIVGGCNPDNEEDGATSISNENFSFDLASGAWNKEPELKTPRRSFGLVTCANRLYAIGGQDKNETTLPSVERYDTQHRIWEEVASLPEPTIGAAICVHKNHIWVAGGMTGSATNVNMSRDVWCYDPRQDVWVKKPPLRFGRAFAALSTFEDSLLLVGGITVENGGQVIVSNDNIDVWDGDNMMWKLKGQMALPRHGHSIVFLGSMMVLMGGVTSKSTKGLTQVDTLCMLSGSRSRHVAPLPSPLVGHGTVLFTPLNE